jgi:hypothetical protein
LKKKLFFSINSLQKKAVKMQEESRIGKKKLLIEKI